MPLVEPQDLNGSPLSNNLEANPNNSANPAWEVKNDGTTNWQNPQPRRADLESSISAGSRWQPMSGAGAPARQTTFTQNLSSQSLNQEAIQPTMQPVAPLNPVYNAPDTAQSTVGTPQSPAYSEMAPAAGFGPNPNFMAQSNPMGDRQNNSWVNTNPALDPRLNLSPQPAVVQASPQAQSLTAEPNQLNEFNQVDQPNQVNTPQQAPILATNNSEAEPQDPSLGNQSLKNPNLEILAELKHERDELRDIHHEGKKSYKKTALNLLMLILAIAVLGGIFYFVVRPKAQPQEDPAQVGFVVPADINTRPEEEQIALQVLSLARAKDGQKLYTDFLSSRTQQSTDKDEFLSLINRFAEVADGPSTVLVNKEVSKTTFGISGGAELEAASLVYKFAYFGHSNSIFTKLNLFKDPEAGNVWKVFSLEFKADESGNGQSPLTPSLDAANLNNSATESGGGSAPTDSNSGPGGEPAVDPNDENSL